MLTNKHTYLVRARCRSIRTMTASGAGHCTTRKSYGAVRLAAAGSSSTLAHNFLPGVLRLRSPHQSHLPTPTTTTPTNTHTHNYIFSHPTPHSPPCMPSAAHVQARHHP